MHKKILAVCTALVALGALALPAMASASVTLQENGVKVEPGGKVLATNDEEALFKSGELTINCDENKLTGTVIKNDGTTVEWEIESASFQSNLKAETKCDGGLFGATTMKIPALETGGNWCLSNIAGENRFEVIGAECGKVEGVFTFQLVGAGGTCTYTRTALLVGTFTTTSGTAATTLAVTREPAFKKEEPSALLCPAEVKISKMKFNFFTDTAEEQTLQLNDVS